jgi:hypothetical protein
MMEAVVFETSFYDGGSRQLMQINKNADGTDSKKLEKAILEV